MRVPLTALDRPASVTTLSGTDIRSREDITVNSAVLRPAPPSAEPHRSR